MTQRFVVIDDATQQEIPIGTMYYHVEIEYVEADTSFNTGVVKYMYRDSTDWNAIGVLINTMLPPNTDKVIITRKTDS